MELKSSNSLTCDLTRDLIFFIYLSSTMENSNKEQVMQSTKIFIMLERVNGCSCIELFSRFFPSLGENLVIVRISSNSESHLSQFITSSYTYFDMFTSKCNNKIA